MSRVALVCSEPIRDRMAGIGIRYLELFRRLEDAGLETVLVTTGDPGDVPGPIADASRVRRYRGDALADCTAAVVQGVMGDAVLRDNPDLPVAVDLYDPWLVENLHYADALGSRAYDIDYASWRLQLARGDFFLCSCAEQRLFYLGLLTAFGRISPARHAGDPLLERLVAAVPFGVPEAVPAHRPLLPPREPGRARLLFGGVYDWLDPLVVLDALERLPDSVWQLVFVASPNPKTTSQHMMQAVRHRSQELGWLGDRVLIIDWTSADRRFDLLRDVDLLVTTHRHSLEAELALRTRVLEALALSIPVVVTEGGATSRLVSRYEAGWVVPPADPSTLAATLHPLLTNPAGRRRFEAGARRLAACFDWHRALAPLVTFCRSPWHDSSRLPLETIDPVGGRGRLRRLWRTVRSEGAGV